MKRTLLTVFAILAVTLLLPLCASAAVGLSDVIRTLEQPFQHDGSPGKIQDFEADFFQESHMASLDKLQRGRGKVSVRFEQSSRDRVPLAMFRWLYDQPTNQEIVSNGETMWVYLPENLQVIQSDISELNQKSADNPATFLTGLGNLSRDFQITYGYPNQDIEGNYVLELRPRRTSALFNRLLIVVDRDAVLDLVKNGTTGRLYPILSTTVYDPYDNMTLIEFSDARVNRGMSRLSFDFIMPPGVEVIRPSGMEMGF